MKQDGVGERGSRGETPVFGGQGAEDDGLHGFPHDRSVRESHSHPPHDPHAGSVRSLPLHGNLLSQRFDVGFIFCCRISRSLRLFFIKYAV